MNEPAAVPASPEPSLFAGIEQRGAELSSAEAPVTLVEYADLQCPYCAQWAREALPTVAEEYVKTGKLRIIFRGLGSASTGTTVQPYRTFASSIDSAAVASTTSGVSG